jgi:hypothetical protein
MFLWVFLATSSFQSALEAHKNFHEQDLLRSSCVFLMRFRMWSFLSEQLKICINIYLAWFIWIIFKVVTYLSLFKIRLWKLTFLGFQLQNHDSWTNSKASKILLCYLQNTISKIAFLTKERVTEKCHKSHSNSILISHTVSRTSIAEVTLTVCC